MKPGVVPSVFDFQVKSHKEKSEAAKRTDPDGHSIGARGRGSESTEKNVSQNLQSGGGKRPKEVSCICLLVYLKQNKI